MTSRDRSLRQIEDFLKTHPNASVRVKFNGDDNYRNYPSGGVTNDTFCDTTDEGVAFEDDETEICDTVATVKRHLSFLEWFKINDLEGGSDTVATPSTPSVARDDNATAEPQTRTPLGVRLAAGDAPSVDWADFSEKQFEQALQTITCLEELNGLANRRRVLQRDCKQWSEAQRSLILMRKFMLENGHG
jgi:hypothetical protein